MTTETRTRLDEIAQEIASAMQAARDEIGATEQQRIAFGYAEAAMRSALADAIERPVEDNGGFVAGPITFNADEECWTAEVQLSGGYFVAAEVYAVTEAEAGERQRTVIAALESRPQPIVTTDGLVERLRTKAKALEADIDTMFFADEIASEFRLAADRIASLERALTEARKWISIHHGSGLPIVQEIDSALSTTHPLNADEEAR